MNKFLDAPIEKKPFVSRAGTKLEHALEDFGLSVDGLVCAGLGASTGGFTDCLLQRGARKVYAIDTGHGMLDWKLRENNRVVVMEKTNAMHVELPELVGLITIDVGWTKQRSILPSAIKLLRSKGNIVTLVKPHYEADKCQLRKGVLNPKHIPDVLQSVRSDAEILGLSTQGEVESPIRGQKGGNIEYLLWLKA